ncbi:23S rRNA (guanosine(2251)-2'-O)-methyltransferase RlmB [Terrilactibacillus sp. BCM23-1]|uniref:23S rRNA (Guanosine(2251)-2'-O)-methyltransferase RlmB n=1 Tax=Terrilactibacillus tamarindi TaxID=2599694 RepID=A0A6N8CU37_9BACI|nr:23S rRNA (guanosine(2251)-2'-O)-methyltransferase RlmB [Terrilactibacillus tamarindi]MTT32787.1 23S rRNA (guanosine(2251)-2'-O)-methyltransferase RlmB [Terrilactibacillus tamarindi]
MSDNEFIIGRHAVLEALEAGREINKLWINKESHGVKQLIDKAGQKGVTIQFVPRKKLDQLTNSSTHQGIVASIAAYEYADIDDLFQLAEKKNETPFFILLDGIEDPHNLGSILRTADSVGAHGVIIPKRRAAGLTQVVSKASTGAIEYIPVARVTNLARTIDELKERGIWFAGTAAEGSQDYRKAEFDMPICLVMGNEGKGLSRLVREKCDYLISIPMAGHVTSLNASVAAAILMYEVYRKRNKLED